jgi:hypothetical protein
MQKRRGKIVMEEKGEVSRKGCMLSKVGTAIFLLSVAIAFVSLAVAPVMAQEEEVTVTVNAPELVVEKETFEVTIDVDSITDFNTGLFDLTFDHKVVKVDDVTDGSIDDITIPIGMWDDMDKGTIRVFFTVPEATGVSGSGYLAKISFNVKGDEGDECVLEIENGFLGNTTAEEIVADWIDATIKIGKKEGEEEQQPPPSITALVPAEEAVSSTEGKSITFEIIIDQEVDISWQINGTEMQTDEGVTKAAYTNTSAVAGTWNVSAIATNTETRLSSTHTWIWSVTPASTEASEGTPTPTPTLAQGVTSTQTSQHLHLNQRRQHQHPHQKRPDSKRYLQ